MIYLLENPNAFSRKFLSEKFEIMPIERKQKANRYRNEIDRKLCILAYSLLMDGLFKEYEIKDSVRFIYNEYGKPFLKDYPEVFFNLSHCRYGVVCGISNKPIGVDIQDIQKFNIDVTQRVCNETELNFILNSKNKDLEFCKLWAAKEAVIKKTGTSISADLKQIDTLNVKEIKTTKFFTAMESRSII